MGKKLKPDSLNKREDAENRDNPDTREETVGSGVAAISDGVAKEVAGVVAESVNSRAEKIRAELDKIRAGMICEFERVITFFESGNVGDAIGLLAEIDEFMADLHMTHEELGIAADHQAITQKFNEMLSQKPSYSASEFVKIALQATIDGNKILIYPENLVLLIKQGYNYPDINLATDEARIFFSDLANIVILQLKNVEPEQHQELFNVLINFALEGISRGVFKYHDLFGAEDLETSKKMVSELEKLTGEKIGVTLAKIAIRLIRAGENVEQGELEAIGYLIDLNITTYEELGITPEELEQFIALASDDLDKTLIQ